ncbi:redox-active disulfide protein 2 [Vibrio sp. 10N.286.49.C2]|uniref:thioredoxin family protein n=1 Tax=unclassified Vibrio TaxID=2614977 RepID=UPI000C82C8A6|nr:MULTISPECIES: thioredoxin family protein [unclassified Vibrio]PMH30329.1 redox-active disulfide protein 2 [Vibrio sp. 10N.286.49.C2]PMH50850.1 redox-active disulfide protein 2 [Vibrio sp. 10N.286.49.B1]PMH79563.1 redox-active disulfide protein 2 [Vibrio sp. 10N.286.48.B7]
MKIVQVYGSGCKNCTITAQRIEQVANDLGQLVDVQKVTSLQAIMEAGIVSTPGVGIDGVVRHTGSVPSVEKVREILA